MPQGKYCVNDLFKINAQQNEKEFAWFTDILKRENVTSYLEIGSKHGSALWGVANVLPKGSLVVSVDLPWGNGHTIPHLKQCISQLRDIGYDARLFLEDSTDSKVIERVRAIGPFDACFIDANHTEQFVRADWKNYGPMARIVAFHDIGWIARPLRPGKMPIDVPKVWNEIKTYYKHQECKLEKRDNGIGVLWRC